jgi:hypothetical protein
MNPTSCLLVSRFDENPFFLLAVALLFVEKIRQSDAPFWFGLRIFGFLQIFYSRAVIQRAIVVLSSIFGARFGGKDRGLCTYNP